MRGGDVLIGESCETAAWGHAAYRGVSVIQRRLGTGQKGTPMESAVAARVGVVQTEFSDATEEEGDEARRRVVDALEVLGNAPLLPGGPGGFRVRVEGCLHQETVGTGGPGGSVEDALDHRTGSGFRVRVPWLSVHASSASARTAGTWVMTRIAGGGWRERRLKDGEVASVRSKIRRMSQPIGRAVAHWRTEMRMPEVRRTRKGRSSLARARHG
jgi:hypothetical protein